MAIGKKLISSKRSQLKKEQSVKEKELKNSQDPVLQNLEQ